MLYRLVAEHLESFLAAAPGHTSTGAGYPKFIEDELRSYLTCGILAHGFARVVCPDCRAEDLVAFSCKGRLCPSCTTRHMNETAAQLCDYTLPPIGYRQWTLSVPWRYRLALARDGALLSRCLQLMLRAIFTWQRRRARKLGIVAPQTGAISFTQRFGSTINLHPHWHSLIPDGVFAEVDGRWQCVELPPPTDEEVALLCETIGRRITDDLEQRLDVANADDIDDDDAMPAGAVADALQVPLPSLGASTESRPPRPRCAWVDGFSLDANVAVAAEDRAGLERLCRYGGRPAFAASRLRMLPDGQVAYRLRKPWYTGQTQIVMKPQTLLRRLAAIVPPRGQHQIRFHGCFAPRAACRSDVLALVEVPTTADDTDVGSCKHVAEHATAEHATAGPFGDELDSSSTDSSRRRRPSRMTWAMLLKRTFRADLLTCACGGKRRVIACLTDPQPIAAILDHLGLPTEPPRIAPARAPPQLDWFDDLPEPSADVIDWAE